MIRIFIYFLQSFNNLHVFNHIDLLNELLVFSFQFIDIFFVYIQNTRLYEKQLLLSFNSF